MKQVLRTFVKELHYPRTLKKDIMPLLTPELKVEYLKWYDEKMKRVTGKTWETDINGLVDIVDWAYMIESEDFLEWLEG